MPMFLAARALYETCCRAQLVLWMSHTGHGEKNALACSTNELIHFNFLFFKPKMRVLKVFSVKFYFVPFFFHGLSLTSMNR